MNVRKIVLGLSLFCLVSSGVRAQDDMYFVPKKVDKTEVAEERSVVRAIPMRDVDEYNRRGQFSSQYQSVDLDTLYSDVIIMDTASVDTTTENALAVNDFEYAYDPQDDYTYSRRLSRYDDYYWHDPWYYGWYGYGPYWYGSPYWYAGWWYDPWYDPWFYGWHRPWGWYYSWYRPVVYYRPYRGITGTTNHGRPYRNNGIGNTNFKGYRGTSNRVNNRRPYDRNNGNSNYNNRFRGNRQDNYNWNNNQSRPTYNNSFGGNRSGGSFRGGGSFGGSRSGGGGGGFRGRR